MHHFESKNFFLHHFEFKNLLVSASLSVLFMKLQICKIKSFLITHTSRHPSSLSFLYNINIYRSMWYKAMRAKGSIFPSFNCQFSLWDQLQTTCTICLSNCPFPCRLLLMNFILLTWITSTALNSSFLSSAFCPKAKYFSWTKSKLRVDVSHIDPGICVRVFSMWKFFNYFSVCHSTYIYFVCPQNWISILLRL